ncbi:unnamed protein product [Peronospora effusa]|nr:unnamed protein product [Peronospora effusa]
MATEKRRNMVLHFDLNRPVIISDAAGGRSTFGCRANEPVLKVVQELDLLVDGHHLIGLPTMADHFRLKLQPSARCAATFYRDGFEADDTALAVGTLIKVLFSTKLAKEEAYSPNN